MRKSKRYEWRNETSYDPALSHGVLAVIVGIAGAIIILSFFGLAGTLGVVLNDWLLPALFGGMRYAVPAFLLVFAWLLGKDGTNAFHPARITGAALFLLSASGFLHIERAPEKMWSAALAGEGGGLSGMIAYPLKTGTGYAGSIVILFGLSLVSLLLLFKTSPVTMIFAPQRLLTKIGTILRQITVAMVRHIHGKDAPNAWGNADYEQENDSGDSAQAPFVSRQIQTSRIVAPDNVEDGASANQQQEEDTADKNHDTDASAGPWTKRVIVRPLPPTSLLADKRAKPTSGDIKNNAEIIQNTLSEFGISVDMGEIRVGPTVTQYALKPHKGIKLSRITNLGNDLALALAAHPIRIEAPIPGKSLIGIEVPNQKTAIVGLKEMVESREFRNRPHSMMIALGKDVTGNVWIADLPRMPHLLIAGATGSGKTVCINTILMSMLFQNTAETLRLILVDPKRVELTLYNGIPHLMTPVVTTIPKTVNALKWTIGEMERRFETLSQAGNRDIASYNARRRDGRMPHIVFVIDELADLMATAASEIEAGIIRLAQMARAVGIHLVVATQRPSVDVITGLMKANIPARIAFSVASVIDSRTILDSPGAEKLLGRGDMLFQTAELTKPVRLQGAYISEDELKTVVEHLCGDEEPEYDDSIVEKTAGNTGTVSLFGGADDDQDPLFEETKTEIIRAGKASASFLQRKFKIGYARAARLLDELEAAGIIGPGEGAKPREILVIAGEEMGASGGEANVFDDRAEKKEAAAP